MLQTDFVTIQISKDYNNACCVYAANQWAEYNWSNAKSLGKL